MDSCVCIAFPGETKFVVLMHQKISSICTKIEQNLTFPGYPSFSAFRAPCGVN